jgi:hypothetical protein
MWWIIGYAILLIIVWMIAMKIFPHTVTWKEGLISLGVQMVIVSAITFGSMYGQGSDTQILNGEVTKKVREEVSCSHSYDCNCYNSCSGSGSSRTCTRICQTCYEHSYDVDWDVYSNIGGLTIDRVDRQGLKEPRRWADVKIGDPFSREVGYYNYIKASPFSIFNKSELDKITAVPPYLAVYDYYKINRVINFGSPYKPTNELNDLLNNTLKVLGPEKKVNVVVVLHNKGNLFSEVLRTKQLGGKINDVTVVIDVDKDGVFNHVAVFSWSKNDLVNVSLRDALLDIGKWDAVAMNGVIGYNINRYYERRNIEEFRYLDDEVEVPTWAVWMLIVFGLVFPFGAVAFAHKNDFG